MNTRSVVFVMLAVVLSLALGGCGCFMQAMKGEKAPQKVADVTKVPPVEKKMEMPVTKAAITPPATATKPGAGAKAGASASGGPSAADKKAADAARAALASTVVLQDIHFDFDKYNIRTSDGEILKKNAEWFKANTGKKVRIEGHCDERGSIEYNLVLGQKRADSTKTYLMNLGADARTIETISYGKLRPVDPGHSEDAWAKNRRAHLEPTK